MNLILGDIERTRVQESIYMPSFKVFRKFEYALINPDLYAMSWLNFILCNLVFL